MTTVPVVAEKELTRNQIYYARHREEKLQKVLMRYHSDPIRTEKRAAAEKERARKALEREAKKEREREEKEERKKERERLARERQAERLAWMAGRARCGRKGSKETSSTGRHNTDGGEDNARTFSEGSS